MIRFNQTIEGIDEVRQLQNVQFINGDNIALMRWMRDEMMYKYFHVGIVDPPYGISVGSMNLGATKDTVRNYDMGNWDNATPDQEYWDLLWYLCRNLIVWGGNYFVSNLGQVKDIRKEDAPVIGVPDGRCFLTWDKMNDKMSFAHGELALTTFDKNAQIIRRPRNASTIEEEKERRHPTQKPVYLYDAIHLSFVEKNQRVLDTHGGSHSHAVAALKNKVDLTIVERHKPYFEDGYKACENYLGKGLRLF